MCGSKQQCKLSIRRCFSSKLGSTILEFGFILENYSLWLLDNERSSLQPHKPRIYDTSSNDSSLLVRMTTETRIVQEFKNHSEMRNSSSIEMCPVNS